MIKVKIFYNHNQDIWGLALSQHDKSIVCAGVSALTLNAVNSIEQFTDEKFTCEHEEKGGLLAIKLPEIREGKHSHDAALLLNSLVLGLHNIANEYPNSIRIQEFTGTDDSRLSLKE